LATIPGRRQAIIHSSKNLNEIAIPENGEIYELL
jgi:hypothetical protein